mmetsp:Transcript_23652/g.35012  ORF Transcript_23652/g.35012 Transcript_23652/m.35012 type:complete len:127 (-) Transcript_23652:587-967(-)
MFATGDITEEFYDKLGFESDKDAQGNEYPLTSDNVIRCRSRPLYHKRHIATYRLGAELVVHELEEAPNLPIKKAEDTISGAREAVTGCAAWSSLASKAAHSCTYLYALRHSWVSPITGSIEKGKTR